MRERAAGATLVWFRLDLRIGDNPALAAAAARGGPVVPVYIWAPEEEGDWPPGAASRWWLHHSLRSLATDLERLGMRLVVRRGPSLATLRAVAAECGADRVVWNRRYEPALVARDQRVKEALPLAGIEAQSYDSALLFEPWTVTTREGTPFQVFTPFWKACLVHPPPEPTAAPRRMRVPEAWPTSLAVADLGLEPEVDWAAGLRATWRPGEEGARAQLARFLDATVGGYRENRDRPGLGGTSRLSPHLHFGEIGPRLVWYAIERVAGRSGADQEGAAAFQRELGWREFAYHVLFHFPHVPVRPLRAEFARFPWEESAARLRAWQRGRTGYPLVDAGMRELWATGWMHNRVRMVAASFLVKHLLQPWLSGARWFWDTLVDADLANNSLGWQWVTGCGADAAPYFRIFNPTAQGEQVDPHGTYVRRWIPELANVDERLVHRPWEPAAHLSAPAYPAPIVDHAAARAGALAALTRMREMRA
jgi:deoxyribodipyrimidine photo-lyase